MTAPLLIFDIDGTLVQSTKLDDQCFREVFSRQYSIDFTTVDWSRFRHVTDWGLSYELLKKYRNIKLTFGELELIKTSFVKLLDSEIRRNGLHEVIGAKNFLNDCIDRKIPIAFATGGWLSSAILKMGAIGFPVQNFPLATSDIAWSRESIVTTAIRMAIDYYSIDFTHIIYFGDGKWDVRCCQLLNLPMIGVDHNDVGKLEEFDLLGVINDFTSTEEVNQLISKVFTY